MEFDIQFYTKKIFSKIWLSIVDLTRLMFSNWQRSSTRDHVCQICGKSCQSSASLQAHNRTHTGEKPFKCEICGKGWADKSNLRVHMRIHTGEKPYKCDVCGKTFTQKSNYRTHISLQHRMTSDKLIV